MRYGHQARANGAKPIAAQQVQGQGAQQGKDLHAVALAVVVSVLTELGVAGPVPWVLMAQRWRTSRSSALGLVRRVVM